jgi:hypothetical protein
MDNPTISTDLVQHVSCKGIADIAHHILCRLNATSGTYSGRLFQIINIPLPSPVPPTTMQSQSTASSSLSRHSTPTPSTSTITTPSGKPDRLYVGNLAPTVDEYTLIQIFTKYGKITKLDFIFHKTGVLKGKPRGFAFVEMSSKDVSWLALGVWCWNGPWSVFRRADWGP